MELLVFFVEMNHDGMIVQGVRDVLEGGSGYPPSSLIRHPVRS